MSQESEIAEIQEGLAALFVGKDKRLSLIAALSIAATTGHMLGMTKIELQEILVRCFDRRIAEERGAKNDAAV